LSQKWQVPALSKLILTKITKITTFSTINNMDDKVVASAPAIDAAAVNAIAALVVATSTVAPAPTPATAEVSVDKNNNIKKVKQKEKPLAMELEGIKDCDIANNVVASEMDDYLKSDSPGPHEVAVGITIATTTTDGDNTDKFVDIKNLTTDQIWTICKRFGCLNYSCKRSPKRSSRTSNWRLL
jgi:hypothetical protein